MEKNDPGPLDKPLVSFLQESLDDDKAENIKVIDLEGKSTMADAMIVASGMSQRHLSSMADHIIKKLKKLGWKNIAVEGLQQCDWILIDAGDVIVHLFKPEIRTLYNLERMWGIIVSEAERVSA